MTTLEDPIQLPGHQVRNRIWMAAMTRARARADGCIGDLAAQYYAQRASAGLVVSEGLFPCEAGRGYALTPGLANAAQAAAWEPATRRLREHGTPFFAQLMHAGRVAHPSVLPPGVQPCAPSAVAAAGSVWTADGEQPLTVPRALSRSDIATVIDEHVQAARRAMAAGFAGVQLHAGSGYLCMQFLAANSNRRSDAYGGSPRNRARFVIELVEALAATVGARRTSLKLTPGKRFNDIDDGEWPHTCNALLTALRPLPLAFVECAPDTGTSDADAAVHEALRACVPGPYTVGGGSAVALPQSLLARHGADAVMFGRAFIANPDLPARLHMRRPLHAVDTDTVYGGDHRGYTDYGVSTVDADRTQASAHNAQETS